MRRRAIDGSAGRRIIIASAAALSLVGSLAAPSNAYVRPGVTDIVSVAADGSQGREPVEIPLIVQGCTSIGVCMSDVSANGRFVVFESLLEGLVPDDTNAMGDIFVKDLKSGGIERVSVTSDGTEAVGLCAEPSAGTDGASAGKGGSWQPSISATGRFVAFSSCATNLSPIDDPKAEDVFVHDRRTGKTELVSASSDGVPAVCVNLLEGCSRLWTNQSISASGRYVVFSSAAPNLVPGDTNGTEDVFIRDRGEGTTKRASIDADGDQVGGANLNVLAVEWGSLAPAISDDGRFVAFQSDAPDLVSNGPDDPVVDRIDVFVKDLTTGEVEQIDITDEGREEVVSTGTHFNGTSQIGGVAISGDGRFVGFSSRWEGFVSNDANDAYDVFVRDRKTGRFERVSVNASGMAPDSYSIGRMAFSRDGRFVSFFGNARLVPEDDEGGPCGSPASVADLACATALGAADHDVYVHDRATGGIDLVSWDFGGTDDCPLDDSGRSTCAGGTARWPSLDASGRFVSFSGHNHVSKDDNGAVDIFLRDRGPILGGALSGGSPRTDESPPDDQICVTPELCIPPGAAVSSSDVINDLDKVLTKQGANLYGASLAYRPQYSDLFATIELEHMPKAVAGLSAVFYGLNFNVEDRSYEVRITSLFGGTFGLFDCSNSLTCTKAADLRGGYGTTGERVVVSLPLEKIGLKDGGAITKLEVFSAFGSYASGAQMVYDRLKIR